jgi:hypothetical protein
LNVNSPVAIGSGIALGLELEDSEPELGAGELELGASELELCPCDTELGADELEL